MICCGFLYVSDYYILAAENNRLKKLNACKICITKIANVVFLPGGHLVSCGMCAPALNKCLLCKRDINGMVKAVFAKTADGFF